jgi:signal transduction histidine kinase
LGVSSKTFWTVVAMPLIAACALVADAKLTHVVRAVTAGGRARRLREDLFWLGRPRLLLVPIKAALFLISFLFGAWLLFVWQFGASSCPFSDSFYPGWAIPWWTILLLNFILLLHLSAVTLPSFALAAAVGARLAPEMLPPTLSRRLAAVVEAYVARMRAEPAAEGDEALRLARSVEHIKKTRARRRGRLVAAASVVVRRLVGTGEH